MTSKQIRSRTWKYFFKQKGKEIYDALLVVFIIVGVAGLVFQLGWICEGGFVDDGTCIEPYEPMFPYWVMISGFITTGIWILIGLVYWIRENWKYASEKAKEDFK